MKVFFVEPTVPCVDTEVTRWHMQHGWLWDVVTASGEHLGVIFCTLLCGDGAIVHFTPLPGADIPPTAMLGALRKMIRMIPPVCPILLATVPDDDGHAHLIRVLIRLGFARTNADFARTDGQDVAVLKYLPPKNDTV